MTYEPLEETPASGRSRRPSELPWLERASELLAEPDPGPTPMLVDGRDRRPGDRRRRSGRWKVAKTLQRCSTSRSRSSPAATAFGRYAG